MASFQLRGNSVRAIIRRRSHNESKSFKNRELAEAWAAARELEIDRQELKIAGVPKLIEDRLSFLSGFPGAADVVRAGFPICRSAVYFLIQRSKVVYVGQSADVHVRLGDHARNNGYGRDFDRFAVLPCEPELRLGIESHYIKLFKPKYNTHGKPVDWAR